jgi:uncharacterized caspase-like protein
MLRGRLRAGVLSILLLFGAVATAQAERRVALVMGNSDYKNVSRLPNPGNDATAVAKLFKDAGFDVIESKRDLNIADMRRAVRDFSNTVRDADIAVVYYAGHGIEVDGTNYLIPVDAALENDVDVEDETLSLDRFLKVLEPVKRLRLVILDACRDNPFAKTMKRSMGSRAVSRGLAKVEPQSSDTLIAFAAKAGSTASDGDGGNSPFARAIVKNIAVPGVDLRIAFGRVRDEVLKATNSKQEPFVYGSLGGTELSLVPALAPKAAEAPAAAPVDPNAEARRDYEFVERIGTLQAWDEFLSVHKTGMFANLARAQRAKIAAAETTRAAEVDKDAKAETARANAAAKALEEAKAAEAKVNKQLEAMKAAEAERNAKAEAAAKAAEAERIAKAEAAAKAEAVKIEAAAKAEAAKLAAAVKADAAKVETAARSAAAKDEQQTQVAVLTPPPEEKPKPAGPSVGEVARSLQTELRRVGCFAAGVDGNWNAASVKALDAFNKYSGLKLDSKTASLDTLDAVKQKGSRICPLACNKGFEAKGEACVAKTCPAGQELDGDGDCARIKTASRPEPKDAAPKAAPAAAPAKPAEPKASGGATHCGIEFRGCAQGSWQKEVIPGRHCFWMKDRGQFFCKS